MKNKLVLAIGAAPAVVSLGAAACNVCGNVKQVLETRVEHEDHSHSRG